MVEILSKDDRASDLEDKIDDYLTFGVTYIWVVDPQNQRGYVYTSQQRHEVTDALWTMSPDFTLPLAQLF